VPTAKFISKEDCLRAMENTRSNRGAARFLRCSFVHYKKYARTYTNDDGITLWEAHKNPSGKGIPKYLPNKGKKAPLKELIEGKLSVDSFEPAKIKQRLIFEGYLKEECSRCGFHEERVTDQKIPLILQFKDKNKKNYEISNIELMCYNCSYLYATSPITEKQVLAMEDSVERQQNNFDWEVDDVMKEHLQSLGLWQEPTSSPTQYISSDYKGNAQKD
jgi:hypothetical protein